MVELREGDFNLGCAYLQPYRPPLRHTEWSTEPSLHVTPISLVTSVSQDRALLLISALAAAPGGYAVSVDIKKLSLLIIHVIFSGTEAPWHVACAI